MRLVALDPGENTGFAIFDCHRLVGAGTFKFDHAAPRLDAWIATGLVEEVVIEDPGTRGWSDRPGMGTLNKRVGYLWGFMDCVRIPVHLIQVSTWKGNKAKKVTARDMGLIYSEAFGIGWNDLDQNAIDAVGLGHWWVGRGRLNLMGKGKG